MGRVPAGVFPGLLCGSPRSTGANESSTAEFPDEIVAWSKLHTMLLLVVLRPKFEDRLPSMSSREVARATWHSAP